MDDFRETSFTFTWKVENYPSFFAKIGSCITSPRFIAQNVRVSEWYLELYPVEDTIYFRCFLSRYLQSVDLPGKEVINYKLEICDKDENVKFSKQFRHSGFLDYSGLDKTVKMEQFYDEMNKATFIVRVYFISNYKKSYLYKECSVKSTFFPNNYTFKWNINSHSEVDKTSFLCDNVIYEAFFDRSKNIFQIKATEGFKKDYSVICKLSLLDTEGSLKTNKSMKYVFNSIDDTVQFPISFNEEACNGKERQNLNWANIAVIGDFSILDEPSSVSLYVEPNPSARLFDDNPSARLVDDNPSARLVDDNPSARLVDDNPTAKSSDSFHEVLQTMYTDKIFPDVEFRVGKEVFSAHRNVLSVHSPVFHAMFSQGMAEKESGVVEIKDVDPQSFDVFLQYFYSGKVDNIDYEKALKLLVLGDKYDIHSLVTKCTDFLASNISTETALDVLVAADSIHQIHLKNSAVNYIKSNAPTVLKTGNWKKFIVSNVGLAAEIVAEVTENLNNIFGK